MTSDAQKLIKKRYEFFEHTADAKFRAYGANLEEAFSNSAIALTKIMTDPEKIECAKKKTIKLESKNTQSLLYDFLSHLVFFMDADGFICSKVESLSIKKLSGKLALNAIISGDSADRYDIHTQIKAITYSNMMIIEENGFVSVQVVPDL
jgi:SHS2 domain-containing protein